MATMGHPHSVCAVVVLCCLAMSLAVASSEEFVVASDGSVRSLADFPSDDFWQCSKSTSQRAVFNRIYKTGSMSMGQLLDRLAFKNNFSLVRSKNHDFFHTEHGGADMIKALATGIAKGDFSDPAFKVDVQGYQGETGLADRLLYDEHAAFMDFQKWGLASPDYINVVRNPVARFASQYNYDQTIVKLREKQKHRWPCTWNATFDQCLTILREGTCPQREQCGYPNFMTHFLCGNGSPCNDAGSPQALHQALHNLQYKYAHVAVLEDMETSLGVLERQMPNFFKKAQETYKISGRRNSMGGSTSITLSKMSPENLQFARKINANDVILYEAAVKLLARRAKACGVVKATNAAEPAAAPAAE